MTSRPPIPSGCYPTEQWASMLNVPLDAVRLGATVSPFGYGGVLLVFLPCPCDAWQWDGLL